MSTSRLTFGWRSREQPLPARAVLAQRDPTDQLLTSALRRIDSGAELRAAIERDWLLILGEDESLPWSPDATYLGWDRGLLLPTTEEPTLPADLIKRGIEREFASANDLVALTPDVAIVTTNPSDALTTRELIAAARTHPRAGTASSASSERYG